MRDLLIINLTRMGDLIQTTPVLVAAKEMYPDIFITLLINSEFEGIVPYLPGVDRVISINIRQMVKEVDRGDIPGAYRYLKMVLDEVNDRVYDKLINFTHSLDSAVLSSMIRTKEVRG
ncbi:MAG: hypothetical protein D6726_12110, partial [Nitrospirae bacterium]